MIVRYFLTRFPRKLQVNNKNTVYSFHYHGVPPMRTQIKYIFLCIANCCRGKTLFEHFLHWSVCMRSGKVLYENRVLIYWSGGPLRWPPVVPKPRTPCLHEFAIFHTLVNLHDAPCHTNCALSLPRIWLRF